MKQFFIASTLIILTIIFVNFVTVTRPVALIGTLDSIPRTIGNFTMTDSRNFNDAVMKVLGVDNYIMRQYKDRNGYSLWLYIGYYQSQTEGTIIHSPKHCMPGSGWNTFYKSKISIPSSVQNAAPVIINQMILQKGIQKQLAHYWYQGRGRIIANEYVDRLLMIYDSFIRHRSDGALIRITGDAGILSESSQKQQEFSHDLQRILNRYFLP